MKKAKIIFSLLLALLLVFTLFACNKTAQTDTSPAPSTAASASPAPSAAPSASSAPSAAPTSEAPAMTKPSTITIGNTGWLGRFLDALSPAQNVHACDAVYDLLFLIDPITRQPFSRILSDWKYTDDTTFVMTLRPGVTFTNGDTATADDVLFSIAQHFERQSSSVTGLGPMLIDQCSSDGKYTVTLKFSSPYGPGIYGTQIYLFDKAWSRQVGWESQDWYGNPNGTGPYKVTEYVTDDHITLELKDNYWNAANEKFDIQKWIIRYYPDASTMYMALEKGDVSMCAVPNVSDYQRWNKEGSANVGMKLCSMGDNMNFNIGFPNNPIFDDIRVREALAYGVDWASIGKLAMGDLYVPATSSLVTACPYYKNVGAYPYDPEKARQILADAGYKEGDLKIHMYDMATDLRKNLCEAFQYYCQEMGIQVDLEFGDVTSALTVWMEDGGTDCGWYANIFGTLTCEPHVSYGGMYVKGFTWMLSNNQPFIDKCLQALNTVDQNKRKQLYEELQQQIHDEFLIFPVYEDVTAVGYRTEVFTEKEVELYVYSASYFAMHGLSLAD